MGSTLESTMRKEQRLKKLEEYISKTYVDSKLDDELTEWLKEHPDYHMFAQPESNNEVVMSENLSQVFMHRMEKLFKERNLESNCCSLLKIYKDIF